MSNLRRLAVPAPWDWDALDRHLGPRDVRRLAHNTAAARASETSIAVVYHATPVLLFHADGWTEMHTGGYDTLTTRRRLRLALGVRNVYAERGETYLWLWGADPVPLVDGIRFHPTDNRIVRPTDRKTP